MNKSKYVSAQLVEFLDYDQFRHIVDKYKGNHYVKYFCFYRESYFRFHLLSVTNSI